MPGPSLRPRAHNPAPQRALATPNLAARVPDVQVPPVSAASLDDLVQPAPALLPSAPSLASGLAASAPLRDLSNAARGEEGDAGDLGAGNVFDGTETARRPLIDRDPVLVTERPATVRLNRRPFAAQAAPYFAVTLATVLSASAWAGADVPLWEHAPSLPILLSAGFGALTGFLNSLLRPARPYGDWKVDVRSIAPWTLFGLAIGLLPALSSSNFLHWVSAATFGGYALMMAVFHRQARAKRLPQNGALLKNGINRFIGADRNAKIEAARQAYNSATFVAVQDGELSYASRGFDTIYERRGQHAGTGPNGTDLAVLQRALSTADPKTFDILVLFVNAYPRVTPHEPAVVVVRGADNLRKIRFEQGKVTLPTGERFDSDTIEAGVGYAWRSPQR